MVLRVARGVREGESKRERNIYLSGAWPVRWSPAPPVASELLDFTSLFTDMWGLTNGVPRFLANVACS